MQNRENSLHDDDDGSKGKKKAEGVIGMAAGKYLDTLDHLPKKKRSVILGAHPLLRGGCFGNLPWSEEYS